MRRLVGWITVILAGLLVLGVLLDQTILPADSLMTFLLAVFA